MTDAAQNDILHRLDRVLDRERAALLDGDFGALHDVLEEKEGVFATDLITSDADRSRLTALLEKSARNQELLDTAMRGVRAVANRLGTLGRLSRSLEVYDREGRRTVVHNDPASRVQRRA
ncbi:hypothetical protein ATO6_02585 [Oceanicola sp. 22II-s10i]|uniref:flagellar biosynthesis protein FlgN n=1 Tax=Oceanicola sp. 22II-s10i TaxID=1317116 RepID=UPI000B526B72|nr:flagellar biosynthesis protein FlgN [Oceanicola sp. 22II-s10i]OWU85813.1 hypothetical protein ATO6_02585 [Oceanicola sp. 22II-s10i]